VRNLLAVWAGKATLALSRRLGHGGTSLPGVIALRVQPALLSWLAGGLRLGTILITGTNGKTTTASLLAAVLRDLGFRLVHNRSGANLIPGLTSAFLEASRGGRVMADLALMEVDEATVPEAVRQLRPLGVVVTNFFRDQLDRYGELDTTVALVGRGLDAMRGRGFVALNSDDPLVASLGRGRGPEVVYYGVEDPRTGTRTMTQTRELRHCLFCGEALDYDVFYYAHLGRYACPGGDFVRPTPAVQAQDVRLEGALGSEFRLVAPGCSAVAVRVPVPGLYNVYNALAALTVALRLGVDPERAAASLARAEASFGRMEHIAIDGRRALLALVKNPTGYNQVLGTLAAAVARETDPKEDGAGAHDRATAGQGIFLMALNDRYADGTDVSWIWDVDFESFVSAGVAARVVTSGIRAHDLALRLKYAGLPTERVRCIPDLAEALDEALALIPAGGTLFVTPTYTAMLELRDIISRRGYTPQFWERRT